MYRESSTADAWLLAHVVTGIRSIDAPCIGGPLDGEVAYVVTIRATGEAIGRQRWVGMDANDVLVVLDGVPDDIRPSAPDGGRLLGRYVYEEPTGSLVWAASPTTA